MNHSHSPFGALVGALSRNYQTFVAQPTQRTLQSLYEIGTSPLRAAGMFAETAPGKALLGTDVTDPLGPSPGLGDVVPGMRGVKKLLPLLAALPGTPAAMRGAPLTKVMQGGKPQRVYHGTPRVFEEFDLTKASPDSLYGPGAYFTNDPGVASGYAGKRALSTPIIFESQQAALRHAQTIGAPFVTQAKGRWFVDPPVTPNVRPAYLDVTKPFDIDAPVDRNVVGLLQKHFPEGVIEQVKSNADAYRALVALHGTPAAATSVLQRFGYDGITHIGGKISGGEPHRVWIAFKPQQVVAPFQYEAEVLRQLRGADR